MGEVGDGFVELNFAAGNDNGAPITGYKVSSATGPAVTQECASTSCTVTELTNDSEYTFQVVAINDVGESEPSVPSAVARPDVRPERPARPSVERGDEQLTVAWTTPTNRGSAIQSYTVQVQNTQTGRMEPAPQEPPAGPRRRCSRVWRTGSVPLPCPASNLADEPDWSSGPRRSTRQAHKPSGNRPRSGRQSAGGGAHRRLAEDDGERIQR